VSIDSIGKKQRMRTANGQRGETLEMGTIQDLNIDDNPNVEQGFVRARLMSQSPTRLSRAKSPSRYQNK